MSDDRFHNKYRIESARAEWHDYNGGTYFITICTKEREHFFGEVVDGEMVLSEIGNYTTEQFRNATTHYPYAEIPLFTIMPNHVHAVVVISPRDVACYVSTTIEERDVARNLQSIGPNNSNEDVARNVSTAQTEKNEYMAERSPKQGSLAVVIRGIKSAVTKHANENDISFAWQPRFHDHIIRNLEELNAIAAYIENNVTNWKDDEFYTH